MTNVKNTGSFINAEAIIPFSGILTRLAGTYEEKLDSRS
jgi:hypothetical protein